MEETIVDKIMQKDSLSAMRRFATGVLLALSCTFGIPYVAATGAACIAISTTLFYLEKRSDKKQLLNFYKDQIGALQHKSPDNLTLDDLQQVAAPVNEGGKGVSILHKELKDFNHRQILRMVFSSISSIITTGALIGIELASPGFLTGSLNMVMGLGLVGLGHTVVAKTMKGISELMFGDHDLENTLNQRLMRMGETIKGKPVSPLEIFGLLADAQPVVQAQVQQQFGVRYADLPVLQKKQAVERFEPQYRVIGLTEEINKGRVKPGLAGIIMSGENYDTLPGYQHYKALFHTPVATISDKSFETGFKSEEIFTHRNKLLNEREVAAVRKMLH